MTMISIDIKASIAGNEHELTFNVDLHAYNKYIDSITPANKVAPSHNFVRVTYAGDKAAIDKLLMLPGFAVTMAGEIIEEYMPDIEITAKNSNGELPA